MGTIEAVRITALPPVRRAVPLRRGSAPSRVSMEDFFEGRSITFYASGTAALSRAISACIARMSVNSPEVILPAYGCPNLVAACVHAGAFPRLVDLAKNGWSFDTRALGASISGNTVAIVAVNLLGVGDNAVELARFCMANRILLIQDSAQYLPRSPIAWPGDYVILSFGRGKPMNLLHGGALVTPVDTKAQLPLEAARYALLDRLLASGAAGIAFNALTLPPAYRLITLLPATGVGTVVYKPLRNAAPLPEHAWRRIGAAFQSYRARASYSRNIWSSAIEEWSALGITELVCPGSLPTTEPLRLALLAPDRSTRDAIVTGLRRSGLGASRFYGSDLTGVAGIPDAVRYQGPFPHARAHADRLFTLPTHELVTTEVVHLAGDVIRDSSRRVQ